MTAAVGRPRRSKRHRQPMHRHIVAGLVDLFSLTSTTSETWPPLPPPRRRAFFGDDAPNRFILGTRALQSARNRITKSSRQVFFFLPSHQCYSISIGWEDGLLDFSVPGNFQLPFHHHLFPRLVSFGSFFRHCRLFFFFFGFLGKFAVVKLRPAVVDRGRAQQCRQQRLPRQPLITMFSYYDLNNKGWLESRKSWPR